MTVIARFGVALVAVLIAVGCDPEKVPTPTSPAEISVFVIPSSALKRVGQNEQLIAIVSGADNTRVTWRSDNPGIPISASGLVACVSVGIATITATSEADASKRGVAVVRCDPVTPVTVTISPESIPPLTVGQTVQLTATVGGTTNQTVTWKSASTDRVTIDATGLARCVGVGDAIISATAEADPTVIAAQVVRCDAAQLITLDIGTLTFTHVVGSSPCPQTIGTVRVTNTSGQQVSITLTGHSALSVDTGTATFTIPAGGTRDIRVRFNCSTQTSFTGHINFAATAGSRTEIRTVTVAGTITRS